VSRFAVRGHWPAANSRRLIFIGVIPMKTLSHFGIALGLIAVLTLPALAAAKKDRKADPSARLTKKLDSAGLSAEALEKAKKVIADHSAKLKEAQAKADSVLTSEQKAAQKSAMQTAKTSGKKGKDAKAEIEASLKLTDEQKSKLAEARKELAKEQA